MENNTNKKSAFESRMTFVEGVHEMSESAYNVLIGAMLVWGFGINYLLCKFATVPVLRMLAASNNIQMTLILGLVAYFVLAFTGSRLVRAESPAVSFLGYNMIVLPIGLLLTICLVGYDPYIVTRAAMATACVTLVMMMISAIKPYVFLQMGSALCASLIAVILVELIGSLFFGLGRSTFIDYIVVAIMGLFIGFDWARAGVVQRTPTNAISVAASLYLDIINVFLRLLSIMGRRKN